jgi:hypothetical protein
MTSYVLPGVDSELGKCRLSGLHMECSGRTVSPTHLVGRLEMLERLVLFEDPLCPLLVTVGHTAGRAFSP